MVADVCAQVDLKQFNSNLSGRQPGCGHLNIFPRDPRVRPHLRTTGGMTDRAPVSSSHPTALGFGCADGYPRAVKWSQDQHGAPESEVGRSGWNVRASRIQSAPKGWDWCGLQRRAIVTLFLGALTSDLLWEPGVGWRGGGGLLSRTPLKQVCLPASRASGPIPCST